MKPEDRERLAERWLHAGLRQLGQAEPRVGLEARILANLKSEAGKSAAWRRQWWPKLAGVALALLIGAVLFLARGPRPAVTTMATVPARQSAVTQTQKAGAGKLAKEQPPRLRGRVKVRTTAAGNANTSPFLEQFPSPQPLSEQEKLLAQYVEERPQEAVVVARVRAELLKQDLQEFERRDVAPEESQDLKQ